MFKCICNAMTTSIVVPCNAVPIDRATFGLLEERKRAWSARTRRGASNPLLRMASADENVIVVSPAGKLAAAESPPSPRAVLAAAPGAAAIKDIEFVRTWVLQQAAQHQRVVL